MARRNRRTLKNYFETGARPTETQFHDLVDSCLNMNDDGFDKTPQNGMEISTVDDNNGLIGFFRNREIVNTPLWSIQFDQDSDKLLISHREKGSVLTLCPDGRIGMAGNEYPTADLEVGGTIAATGRMGTYHRGAVPADGAWHNITSGLEGCHSFEVVAGAGGRKRDGRYAMLHAIAMNAYNPCGPFFNIFNIKKKIRCTQSYYRSYADKLKLRWHQKNGKYHLQIRSRSPYGPVPRDDTESDSYPYLIRFHISQLWFDPAMEQCRAISDGISL
ncbi:MAG: hypothetical protein JXR76_16500 [Deltaproteobacteria bacterium]|nr:hypothetical protein [Deltaproteobacteria bacterium]